MQRNHKCPLQGSHDFGEIPTWGGFSSNVEYEVGLGRSVEALHCILGSLVRVVRHDLPVSEEKAHLEEEIEIVLSSIEEYSRPVYTEQLRSPGYEEWAKKMVASIESAAPKLKSKAKSAGRRIENSDLPDPVKEIASATYLAISTFAGAAEKSVRKGLPTRETSLFNDVLVEAAVRRVERFIKEHTRRIRESREPLRMEVHGPRAEIGDFVAANSEAVWVLRNESIDRDTSYMLRTRLGLNEEPSTVSELRRIVSASTESDIVLGRVVEDRLSLDESFANTLDVLGHLRVKRVSDRLGIKSSAITDQ